jgi:hypothetical protein
MVGAILITAVGDGIQAGTAAGTVHGIVHGAGDGVIPIITTVGIMAAGAAGMEDITAAGAADITTIGIITTIIPTRQAEA